MTWVLVATVGDIEPGKSYETNFEIDGETVSLFCIDGEYYALGDCSHEQGPLAQGIIEHDTIICPWHSARFDIKTGECISGPVACRTDGHVDLAESAAPERIGPCKTYQTKIDGSNILVKIKTV